MSAIAASPTARPAEPAPVAVLGGRQLLAALAFFLDLATVYQTLVLTDVTGDVIRLGIEADSYDMLWVSIAWGATTLAGIFAGLWLSSWIGGRDTLALSLAVFALGNYLCGAAAGLADMVLARL